MNYVKVQKKIILDFSKKKREWKIYIKNLAGILTADWALETATTAYKQSLTASVTSMTS